MDVMALRRSILAGNSFTLAEYTATGNPMSFDTNVSKPLKSLVIPWTPTQSGTGDPYPPGGGKNLYDATTYPLTESSWVNGANGTITGNALYACTEGYVPCSSFAGQTVTLNKHLPAEAVNPGIAFYDANKDYVSGIKNGGSTGTSWTFEVPATAVYMRFTVLAGSTDIQLEKGSSSTSYAPYSNIRPISGVSAVNVWQTGKNLYNSEFQSGNVSTENGSISIYTYATNRIVSGFIELLPGTYSISCKEGKQSTLYFYESASVSSYVYNERLANWVDNPRNFTLTNKRCVVIVLRNSDNSNIVPADVTEFQLELGESASSYSPYTGQSYPVTFPALGKNLLDPATLEQGGIAENGTEAVNNARVRTGYIPVEEGKTYSVSATDLTAFMHVYDANKTGIGVNLGGVNKTMPEGAAFVRCFFRNASNTNLLPSDVTNAMFSEGSTAQTYEPYTNTVYGGSLNLTTGVLTAEWKYDDMGNYSWENASSANSSYVILSWSNSYNGDNQPYLFADSFNVVSINTFNSKIGVDGYWATINSSKRFYIMSTALNGMTANEVKEFLTGMKFCVKLLEPITYQLTPQEITALIGTNVLWSDTNGSNTAIYLKK